MKFQHILLPIVAATSILSSVALQGAPMDEEAPSAASQAQLLSSTVSYLERVCGAEPYCGAGEPLIVALLDGWERDVRLKLADLVAVRFGFSLPEAHEQFTVPTDDWAPAFYSEYNHVTLLPARSIELRRPRHESWR